MSLKMSIAIISINLLIIGFNLYHIGGSRERVKFLDAGIACHQEHIDHLKSGLFGSDLHNFFNLKEDCFASTNMFIAFTAYKYKQCMESRGY